MNDAHSPSDSGHEVSITVSNGVNGDTTPELVVNGDSDSNTKQLNGAPNGAIAFGHDSPTAESPATPVSNTTVPDVKIDIDCQEQESDARHEPMPIKPIDNVDKQDPVSNSAPSTNGIEHTNDHVNDVHMAEPPPPTPDDVIMGDTGTETPATTPGIQADVSMMNIDASSSYSTPAAEDQHDQPPPAKRARMHSDADKASLAHSATPPPASAVVSKAGTPMPPPTPPPTTLSNAQFRFCQSTIRSLKKVKDASPFLRPVDPVALNIPHYPSIIKTPMDFSTIERKLASSNPSKPDSNSHNARYYNADEFITDVRLIFQNCLTFNGPDHLIVQMGKRVEQVFDKQIKQMPPAVELKPVVKKPVTPPPPPPPPPIIPLKKTTNVARRPSTSVPVIRRSDTETIGRPKREIHPPPPKDLSYADAPKKHRKGKRVKDDGTNEQLKFCSKLLSDLNRKQCYEFASPFYEPVDWVKLELPTYPRIVKKPMDLSTMRKKLDSQLYPNALKFFDDFKLMIRNCFLFNPAGTPVNQAGIELQRLFDEKWKQLPPLREVVSDEEDEEEEDDSEEERQRAIALMESQIEAMRGNIAALKSSKVPKEKKKKEKREKPPVASSSKPTTKPTKALSKKKAKKAISDNDVLTFEQKKDLSECIAKLDEVKLEKVIQIIHEGVPEIRDSTDEIELEIDSLPAAVLTKLYNFVLRPLRTPATKRNRPGKGTGTGGLKRKSMDEDVEAEKIRMLEERMALFDRGPNGGGAGGGGGSVPPPRRDDDSDHSSDSSSNSDSSGSDSE